MFLNFILPSKKVKRELVKLELESKYPVLALDLIEEWMRLEIQWQLVLITLLVENLAEKEDVAVKENVAVKEDDK